MVAQAAAGVIQAGIGIGQSIAGNIRLKRLLQRREDYKTPEEVQQAFEIAQQQAQFGYGADTMAYINSQNNNALTSSLDTVKRLGGNANDISAIFSRNVDAIMKTAGDSEMARVLKFDKLYTQIANVVAGKDAEFADRRAKHDDEMATAAMKVKAGNQNLQSGLGNVMGAFANAGIASKGLPAKTTIPGELKELGNKALASTQAGGALSNITAAPQNSIAAPYGTSVMQTANGPVSVSNNYIKPEWMIRMGI